MGARPVFIGDEHTAIGFRLAGLDVQTDSAGWDEALERAPFVIITAEMAAALPPGVVEAAIRRSDPPVALIPDIRGRSAPADPADRVRRVLGVVDGER